MFRRLFVALPKAYRTAVPRHSLLKNTHLYTSKLYNQRIASFSSDVKGNDGSDPYTLKIDLNDPNSNVDINVEDRTITTKNGDESITYKISDEVQGATLGDNDRYVIMMTCSICDLKMTKTFTKKAYHTGIVIITCDGCDNKHLIADNLGWFRDTSINVEDLAKEKGQQAVKVLNNIKLQQILQSVKYVGHAETVPHTHDPDTPCEHCDHDHDHDHSHGHVHNNPEEVRQIDSAEKKERK